MYGLFLSRAVPMIRSDRNRLFNITTQLNIGVAYYFPCHTQIKDTLSWTVIPLCSHDYSVIPPAATITHTHTLAVRSSKLILTSLVPSLVAWRINRIRVSWKQSWRGRNNAWPKSERKRRERRRRRTRRRMWVERIEEWCRTCWLLAWCRGVGAISIWLLCYSQHAVFIILLSPCPCHSTNPLTVPRPPSSLPPVGVWL